LISGLVAGNEWRIVRTLPWADAVDVITRRAADKTSLTVLSRTERTTSRTISIGVG